MKRQESKTKQDRVRPGQSKPPDLERSEPLSRVRPGQSKPPDLKRSKPLQPRREQTITGKLRSGQARPGQSKPPDFKQSESLGSMVKTTLRAGVGAKASILTRFIRPEQPCPRKDHRSSVVLESQFEDNGKQFFQFGNSGNGASDQLMSGLCRWVKIKKEGNPALYFEMAEQQPTQSTPFQEPKIKWKNSVAKKMLYKDMKDGIVPLEPGGLTLKELYVMLSSLWKSIKKNMSRADEDKAAFDLYAMLDGKAPNPSHCYETT
eukprot:jgi/Psemu1/49899/gm1.49899_g